MLKMCRMFSMALMSVEALLAQSIKLEPNERVHPGTTTGQFETTIVIHPLNPNIVLGSAMTNSPSGSLLSTRLGFYYTTDGASTWHGQDTLPVFPMRTSYDPLVAIDLEGNFFVGGVYRDAWEMVIAKSTDQGTTWSAATVPKPNATTREDKPHMVIDVNQNSPFANSLYLAWTVDTLATGVPGPRQIVFSRSTDKGSTFSAPVQISGSVTGAKMTIGANLAVGPSSELYAVWTKFDRWAPTSGDTIQLGFNKSTDGGNTWQGAQSILKVRTPPFNATKGGNCIRIASSFPSMAVDRSSGVRQGWIYVVYPAVPDPTPDIFMIRSTNSGSSWSDPIKVNQDNGSSDQWMPWMTVDPSTGYLFVIYYDSRNFPLNDSAQVYLSVSYDGGETFKDTLLSNIPFLLSAAFPGGCHTGDYIGISALNGVVRPFWNDNQTGIHQAYTSKVVITSVKEVLSETPIMFSLEQNFPNPFNPTTEIQFSLPQRTYVRLSIFDLLGWEIAILVSEGLSAGSYSTRWNVTDLASGIYLYRLQAGEFVDTKKLLLLR